ncbi:uncharacterized protein isoform X2 [Choristoneura fumiferana]|uniref:uncharacterized protein isoform X2 n=1 Tax=Choristoneura fumiferana TaxID=7141 RepID=UPI003D15B1DC
MTQLMNLMMFLITIKVQFTQTLLTDKEDYFNHKEYELPEFLVDESLFKTEKNLHQNQPWITKDPSSATTASKLKTTKSRLTYNPSRKIIIEASTTSTAQSTTNSTTETITTSTISYVIKLTPKSTTTKPTTKATLKPNTNSSAISTIASTTRPFLIITTPTPSKSLSTKNLVPTAPNQTTTTISWFFYITPKTKKTDNITTVGKITPTATTTAATGTNNGTSTGKSTKSTNETTVTNTTTEIQYFEARLNKVRPKNPTIGTIPTVFQDLTMIRNGFLENGKPQLKSIDKLNQMDARGKLINSLRDKETIEYRELTTEPFSKFLELLMQQLAFMNSANAAKFLRTFERQMGVLISVGKFDALGPAINAYIMDAFKRFHFPIDHQQRMLSMAHGILANRNDTLSPELNSLLDYLDMLYAVKAEVHMERVLNETTAYPNISKTVEEITEGFIEDVLLNPLKRISGTTQGNKLLAAISEIISNKNSLKARRVFSQKYYQYPKRYKKVKSILKFRKANKRRRSKFVLAKENRKGLFVDEYGRIETRTRKQEGGKRMTIAYKNRDGEIKNYIIKSETENEMRSTFKNNGMTKSYSLDFVNRGHEIRKHKRKLTKESKTSNSGEKHFRASFRPINQNSKNFNPFRTLLYKNNKNRFENSYKDKDTYTPYYPRTTPTTKATEQSIILATSQDKNNENNTFNIQPSLHESNVYHKRKVKYGKEANKETIKNFVRQSMKSEFNTLNETGSKSSVITRDVEVTTTTRHSLRLLKSIDKNKPKTTRDTKTTQSEFREANISLKHFYFKPVIIVNKSGDNDDFISIEFDGEPNVIDFSMKVKLKNPITIPTAQKEKDRQNITETTTPLSTNALRVLNPYKMDTYFKKNGTKHSKNRTKSDKESSTESSDSSSDDSEKSEVLSDEGKDSEPHVFGKLRKIENRGHKKQKLRSKKRAKSKKHHRGRKHEKYKGRQRHGKHGKKHRHKYLKAYLKKNHHDRKKRIKHKLKQLKNKRIVGKKFEIDFDASTDDSEQKNLIDVTIVKRAKDSKRATISLVNKGEKFKSSESSISSEEEKSKNTMTKKDKKSSASTKHTKHKDKEKKNTTKAALEVITTGESLNKKKILRNTDHTKEENNQEGDHQEHTTVNNENSDNSDQDISDKSSLSSEETAEITLTPKETTKNKITSPKAKASRSLLKIANKNRKGKKLSSMLIQINKPNKVANESKLSRKIENKVATAHRRFFPIQVFNDSEYSDEEDELKKNLYDAFRHQDELYYRRNMRHELPLKKDLREESDVTDEEIIFKENIYKAFKESNRRSNRHLK